MCLLCTVTSGMLIHIHAAFRSSDVCADNKMVIIVFCTMQKFEACVDALRGAPQGDVMQRNCGIFRCGT